MSAMGVVDAVAFWKNVNGGGRCGSLTKTREPAGPAPTFVKASGADRGGGVWLWR